MSAKSNSRKRKFIFEYVDIIGKLNNKVELLKSKGKSIPNFLINGRMSYVQIYNFIKQ